VKRGIVSRTDDGGVTMFADCHTADARCAYAGGLMMYRSVIRPRVIACSAVAALLLLFVAFTLQRPARASAPFYETAFERRPDVPTLTQLGRTLFFDARLSASGTMSCASCHAPDHAFGPPNDLAVQMGGAALKTPGLRAVPSLMYRAYTPAFDEHYREADGNDSIDQGPAGGYDWDGRAASAHEQAAGPLLSPFEMGNENAAAVVARLRASASAAVFRAAFGAHALDDEQQAWKGLLWALEVFQQDAATFAPFSSKYDAALRGQATLSPAEQRGLKLFNDERKGNCAVCHPSGRVHGGLPLFTDFGLVALGVPRNPRVAANQDPHFFDLGMAGPLRPDFIGRDDACGRFKTPSLRNVATRSVFFHNGAFDKLDEAVRFYAQRDVHPERYYGPAGVPNDLPARCLPTLHREAPFGQAPGGKPALSEAEVQDVVAFLRTLTDGWKPGMH
jgi:cytochrome c peroxidase